MPAGPNLRKLALYDPALAMKVWRVLGGSRFDVMHAHHLEGLLVALPSRFRHGVPIVYDAHTMLSSELPSYGPSFTKRVVSTVGRWFDGVLPNSADHVASVTSDIRDRLTERHGLSPDQISVVTNGVETECFRVDAAPRADGLTRLIYTGTLAPYQDVDVLLEAFAVARRSRADLRLCMAVSSPFDSYEPLARKLGIRDAIEIIPDSFEDLPRQLAECAMTVLPRMHCDGIPQKLLNYMAAGKGIVCSAGSAKLLEHERTGLIVPNGDVNAFAAAIVRLAADPALCNSLGSAARDYVERNYSWDQAAERLERVYARVVPPAVAVASALALLPAQLFLHLPRHLEHDRRRQHVGRLDRETPRVHLAAGKLHSLRACRPTRPRAAPCSNTRTGTAARGPSGRSGACDARATRAAC